MARELIKGDRVRLVYDPDRCGTVVVAGPEQSEVRLDGEKRRTFFFVNRMLVRIVVRAKSRRAMR